MSRQIIKKGSSASAAILISRILGLLRDMLLARVIGGGAVMTAWVLAFKIPNTFRRFFGEGAASQALIPMLGHIIEKEGNLYAYLMFYSYTATGTAPIQEIVINWGGSDQLALAGPFKNRKHGCIRRCGTSYRDAFIEDIGPECANHSDCSEENDSCFALTWGDHEDACVEDNLIKEQDGYFSYSYVYTCDISSDYWRDEGECREYDSILEGGCCIYEPKVTIVDSWGNSKTENLGNCANGKDCSVIIVPK